LAFARRRFPDLGRRRTAKLRRPANARDPDKVASKVVGGSVSAAQSHFAFTTSGNSAALQSRQRALLNLCRT
jgi:hypothetical protein